MVIDDPSMFLVYLFCFLGMLTVVGLVSLVGYVIFFKKH